MLVDYPFSDGTGSKVRPCVVVQSDHNNARLEDTVVVMVTSRTQYAAQEATQFLIRASSLDGIATGVLMDSAVQCENIIIVDRQLIRRRIGSLSPHMIEQLNTCLKASLGL